ncbi:MAG: hypothetical protein KDA86_25465, partial [Planctomycetaceae bacterium]|nr:hypothetical protein [Planctomycetaceae bacterium]
TGTLQEEAASGRFHASIAFTRAAYETAGGWPLTQRGDFDQQFLTRLSQASTTVDPCHTHPPSYVFRWGSTQSYHGQGLMQTASDTQWYDRVPDAYAIPSDVVALVPNADRETQDLLNTMS